MALRYKRNPTQWEIREAYLLGRKHKMFEIFEKPHEGNPYPHDERGWTYLYGWDDYGQRWDERRGGKPPANFDLDAEKQHFYGPPNNVQSSLTKELKELFLSEIS